jgi:hypothetical protein
MARVFAVTPFNPNPQTLHAIEAVTRLRAVNPSLEAQSFAAATPCVSADDLCMALDAVSSGSSLLGLLLTTLARTTPSAGEMGCGCLGCLRGCACRSGCSCWFGCGRGGAARGVFFTLTPSDILAFTSPGGGRGACFSYVRCWWGLYTDHAPTASSYFRWCYGCPVGQPSSSCCGGGGVPTSAVSEFGGTAGAA